LTPYLVVDGAEAAAELYRDAFGAEIISVGKMPDGRVLNAQIRIGNTMLMLNDEFPEFGSLGPNKIGGSASSVHIYVDEPADVDAMYEKAVAAGLEVTMPLDNAFWGDRFVGFKDKFGHKWSVGAQIEEVSPEELQRRMAEMPMGE
jgi:uncharacterized glyoxalase superfamily protein PhnB